MKRALIVISEDKYLSNFMSVFINYDVKVLICNDIKQKREIAERLVDYNLVDEVLYENVDLSHINKKKINDLIQMLKKHDLYDEIYTHEINSNNRSYDVICYCCSKAFKNVKYVENKSYTTEIKRLSKDECWLKKNLFIENYNQENASVETFKKYKKSDIEIYYNKKYNKEYYKDYENSPFIIEAVFAITKILKYYNLKHIKLYGLNEIFIPKRCDISGFEINKGPNFDVSILHSEQDISTINTKYILSVNIKLNLNLIDSVTIPPIYEKLCVDGKKTEIDILRKKVNLYLYEK